MAKPKTDSMSLFLTLPGPVFRMWEDEAMRQSKLLGKKIYVQDCIRLIIETMEPEAVLMKWMNQRFIAEFIDLMEKHRLIFVKDTIRRRMFKE